ncbi:MAG: PQQ-binding-like beta-propeller repeat protein, partial [candidate division Zixibacteria bacterium]|nr:PQQ-binding-like beta-propeller repeat protein [candidate division Zixibacteria bacterium]
DDAINWQLFAEVCCEVPLYTCPANQEWPTHGQNFGRTGYSTNIIGDLTNFAKLWEWQGDYVIAYGHPVIANELVYIAFYDEIVALDLYTGSVVWRTGNPVVGFNPQYTAFMGNANNFLTTTPTIDDGRIYFGTGRSSLTEGIVCADALTGDTIWVRHADLGSPLPGGVGGLTGEMQFTIPVVLGDNVYFGTSFGELYGLNKLTGADVWNVALDQGVVFSPTTDGTDLFVGTSSAGSGPGGTLYKIDPATGATLYTWAGIETPNPNEDFDVAPVYDAEEDAVYVAGTLPAMIGQNQGALIKLAAADLSPLWPSWNLIQAPWYVTPNYMPTPWNRITVGGAATPGGAAWGPYTPGNSTLSSTKQFTAAGSFVWFGDFVNHVGDRWAISSNSFASTCDPYLFAGYIWNEGTWRVMEAMTGNVLLSYRFSGGVLGTAVAEYADEDYVIVATFDSDYGNTFGKVFCFKVGADRPRLHIPDPVVNLDAVSFIDVYPISRFGDVFANIGSAPLTWDMEIVTAKDGAMMASGNGLSKYAEVSETGQFDLHGLENRQLNDQFQGKDNDLGNISRAADFVRFPGGATTTSGVLGAGMLQNQEFVLDPALMDRGPNAFEVTIDSDDPDFNPEDDSPYPHAEPQTSITVVAVKGFAFCDGYIDFGDALQNTSYVNNDGWMSEAGPADAFAIDGVENFCYHHSWFYGYEDDHIAWLDEVTGINGFEPNSVCTFDTFSADIYNATGLDRTITGDRFSASWIDSLKDASGNFDPAATIGMEMFVKEYGGHDVLFNNFKYIYVEIQNRGSDPLPADLYWGTFSDWDAGDYTANVQVGLIGDGLSSYRMFDNTAPEYQYGVGGVPLAGNLFVGGDPTMGAYGTFAVANDPVVYDGIITDSFFNYIDDCPPYTDCYYPGTEVGVNPGQDMSGILTAGKQFVDGDETVKGGVVIFGFNDATAPGAEIADVMNFANKFAGFGRGDVNDDNVVNILDLCVLNCYVAGCGCYPHPFLYLGDVNADGNIDQLDVDYLFNYLFMGGPMPTGDWVVR